MENKIIATRYCLDNESVNYYQRKEEELKHNDYQLTTTNNDYYLNYHKREERLKNSLKNHKPVFYKGYWLRLLFDFDEYGPVWEISDTEDQSKYLYRTRAENYNLKEIVEIFENDLSESKKISDERFEELLIEMYSQPLQIKRFPSIQEAVEKLCEELKKEDDVYETWKGAIAQSFEEACYTSDKEEFKDDERREWLNRVAITAADNFLKLLIR